MKDIKLAVVGTRTFQDKRRVYFEIDEAIKALRLKGFRVTHIVSGLSADECKLKTVEYQKGVDYFAWEYSREKELGYIGYKANWDDMTPPCIRRTSSGRTYNALAGINRNGLIVNDCQAFLAIHLNNSPGTADSIKKAIDAKKMHRIIKL